MPGFVYVAVGQEAGAACFHHLDPSRRLVATDSLVSHALNCLPTALSLPCFSYSQVLDNDFFLVAAKDAFMEAARQFLFENYCRIHQVGGWWVGGVTW